MIEIKDDCFKADLRNLIVKGADAFQWRYWRPVGDDAADHRSFVCDLWCESSETNFFHMLWKLIQKQFTTLQEYNCYRIIANGQVKGQDIVWHTDHCDKTVLYYPFVWKPEWGGSTYFKVADAEQEIKYQENRIVIFDGSILHRGSGPSVENILRVSLAFSLRLKDANG